MSKKSLILLGIAAAVALGSLFAALGLLYFSLDTADTPTMGMVGSDAPDFNLPSLNGHDLSLEQLRGKPVLLNFWATWCDPCLRELPLLEATAQTHTGDLIVVGVSVGESLTAVEHFVERHPLDYAILLDHDEKVGNLYQVQGFPTTMFIDAEGVVRAIYLGEIPSEQLTRNLRLIGIR